MEHLYKLSELVGEKLREAGLLLATAESCTAGFLGKVLTDIPGSSAWYWGGFIVYHNGAKEKLLGVPRGILRKYGAVSRETAQAMCEGILEKTPADIGISITGIAGPTGGSKEKPVGTVWIGMANRQGAIETFRFVFPGNRELIRMHTVAEALKILWRA